MSQDLRITNARIVDGTGAPWFRGSVHVSDGTVTAIERGTATRHTAGTALDVDGSIVCPGFIDTHAHSDIRLFEDGTLQPKIRQGITTEVLGQDGFSMAPMYREGGAEEWSSQLAALAGSATVDWTWGSFGEYLDAVDSSGVAPNIACLVGHGTVRYNVLGMASRAPTDAELEEMGELVTEALDQGAVGFSTGLIYTPCSFADTAEVARLAARLDPFGRPFVAHIRSEGRWVWDALDEFVDIGARESIPIHVSHFKLAGAEQHGKVDRLLGFVETARDRGIDFTAEQYPYAAASTMLSAVLPPWVHEDGPDRVLEKLRDEAIRDRIRRDIEQWQITGWENMGALVGWENIVIASFGGDREGIEGRDIASIASDHNQSSVDAVCDLLVESELDSSITLHMMAEGDVRGILASERVCVCTDGLFGGTPHPRVYGSYPRILGHYVREENLLTVEEAIRKMTSLPARVMGLDSKGVLRPGADADLVVFDPDIVDAQATFARPQQFPVGIPHVLVNGEFVVHDGQTTGETPGSVVRA